MRENRERISRSRHLVLAVIAASAMLVGACSATGAEPSGPAESATTPPSPSAAPATASASAAASAPLSGGGRGDYDYGEPSTEATEAPTAPVAGTIAVGTATGLLGTYLTGPDDLTLYTFAPDSPHTSACDGGCAEAWPPFTVQAGAEFAAGDGVDGDLTTFPRADGTMQVAYDGAPLYYFANDTTPGDTNGQGLGDNWFVAEP